MRSFAQTSKLSTGIYSIPEAARLVKASPRVVRSWVVAGVGDRVPVVVSDYEKIGNQTAVSFNNLMELRFISLFSKAGVKLRHIRAILEEARSTFNHPHPFLRRINFRTDGKKIYAEIEKRDRVDLYDLRTRNYEMLDVVLASLRDDVFFNPDGDAVFWMPRHEIAPNVIVHPRFSFGRPILKSSQIPTEAIFSAFEAEQEKADVVAELYDLPEEQVYEAVRFERDLNTAA